MEEQIQQFVGKAFEVLPEELHLEVKKLVEAYVHNYSVKNNPTEWQGYQLHPNFDPETAQYAYDKLELNKGDIVIGTYPKTGENMICFNTRTLFF